MLWLEMSRDETHGGGEWSFTKALWAPTHKKDGQGTWPFWENVAKVREGDAILHLRGKGRKANFVGISTAETDGFRRFDKPMHPGPWAYASSYYMVRLKNFQKFDTPANLYQDIFAPKDPELRAYFEANRSKNPRKSIFFVIQAKRLQCLNGAYLSEVDIELANIIAPEPPATNIAELQLSPDVKTGELARRIRYRVGQSQFSENIRRNYGSRCCFPECSVTDHEFLVGGHIARWADHVELRGSTTNGLCLCLMHDKAFELGLFTLDRDLRVAANPKYDGAQKWASNAIEPWVGHRIWLPEGAIAPSLQALEHHWARIGYHGPSS